jgi:hypothetical protein
MMRKLTSKGQFGLKPSIDRLKEVQKLRGSLISADSTRMYQTANKDSENNSFPSKLLERIKTKKKEN